MFSSLELADGPLTVYDLEGLHHPPAQIVLSACDSGLSGARPGNGLLGMLASLVSLGTSTVVASVVPVPDIDTRAFMLAYHDALAGGHAPAEALRAAGDAVDDAPPNGFVTRTAFVCFGRG
jgi:CHAT domain-containing protein